MNYLLDIKNDCIGKSATSNPGVGLSQENAEMPHNFPKFQGLKKLNLLN